MIRRLAALCGTLSLCACLNGCLPWRGGSDQVTKLVSGPLALSTTTVSFGSVTVGQSSAATTVTLGNPGNKVLTLTSLVLSDTTNFSLANSCAGTIAAGAQCSIALAFLPHGVAFYPATLAISSDGDSNQNQIITLSGTGAAVPVPGASLSPVSVPFANTVVGTTSAASLVTLTNPGSGTLSIAGMAIAGTNPSNFKLAGGTCGATLAGGTSCGMMVSFSPTAIASYNATLVVTDNAGGAIGSVQSVALIGAGVAPPVPQAAVSPASLSFPATTIGATSTVQNITLSNGGSGPLTIAGMTVSGPNFALAGGTCGSSLAAGSSCLIAVTFTPSAVTSYTGSVVVTDNAGNNAGSMQTVALSGNGLAVPAPLATLSPVSLAFGPTTVGTTSAAQMVMLTNGGTASLSIASIVAGGQGFAISGSTCGTTLTAGFSCSISVTFAPGLVTSYAGNVTVTDNANRVTGSTQAVSLSGTGAAVGTPQASLSASTISFTATQVGTTSAAQTVTLTNPGTGTLTITGMALGGAYSGYFAKTTTCGSTLAAGASCGISVTFTPALSTDYVSSLTVTDNAGGNTSTQTATLHGPGAAQYGCQDIGAALYFSPTKASWTSAYSTGTLASGKQRILIMNPNSGPGTQADPDYTTYLSKVAAARAAGMLVYGYIATGGGTGGVSEATVETQIEQYATWFHVDGLFFDEASADPVKIKSFYQDLATYLAVHHPGAGLFFNVGSFPADDSYMKLTIAPGSQLIVNTFENTYAQYASVTVPAWVNNYAGDHFSHIFHTTPNAQRASAISLAAQANAGWVYVTDLTIGVATPLNPDLANPYRDLPSDWSGLVAASQATCR